MGDVQSDIAVSDRDKKRRRNERKREEMRRREDSSRIRWRTRWTKLRSVKNPEGRINSISFRILLSIVAFATLTFPNWFTLRSMERRVLVKAQDGNVEVASCCWSPTSSTTRQQQKRIEEKRRKKRREKEENASREKSAASSEMHLKEKREKKNHVFFCSTRIGKWTTEKKNVELCVRHQEWFGLALIHQLSRKHFLVAIAHRLTMRYEGWIQDHPWNAANDEAKANSIFQQSFEEMVNQGVASGV